MIDFAFVVRALEQLDLMRALAAVRSTLYIRLLDVAGCCYFRHDFKYVAILITTGK